MSIEKAIPCYFYAFGSVVSYKVLSPSKEVIDNPVFITSEINDTGIVGVMVPYGGYLNFVLDSNHTATTKLVGDNFAVRISSASSETEIKVLLPMVTTIKSVSDS